MEYDLYALKAEMVDRFNIENLRDIYFAMSVDWEDTPGEETKSARSRELLTYLNRHARVPELIHHLQGRMPNNKWNLIKTPSGQHQEFVDELGLGQNFQISTRVFEEKFELYRQVWKNLYELKVAGQVLWERASRENVLNFGNLLKTTTTLVEINSFLFEEDEYSQLVDVLAELGQFQSGKGRLIDVLGLNLDERNIDIDSNEVRYQINENRIIKERYEELLDSIRDSFRDRLNSWTTN